jgi:hypothetical protein
MLAQAFDRFRYRYRILAVEAMVLAEERDQAGQVVECDADGVREGVLR